MAKKPIPTIQQLRQLLRYEPETGKLFWCERGAEMFEASKYQRRSASIWNNKYAGSEVGSKTKGDYVRFSIFKRMMLAHRVAWALHYGEWPQGQIDHINQNRQDNRIVNLREVSNTENNRNKTVTPKSESEVLGVTWDRPRGMWRARINGANGNIFLGRFQTKEEAIEARKNAEVQHGYHANHGGNIRDSKPIARP
jgi:hypothetical protein